MRNKLFLNFITFVLIFLGSNLKAETIFFDSKNIKIEENGNMIFATKGQAKIPANNLIIEGDKFIYNKINSELIVLDDVKYFDNESNIYIESDKIIYNEINNTLFSKSDTYIKSEEDFEINSSDVLYDRNLNKISSFEFSDILFITFIRIYFLIVGYLKNLSKFLLLLIRFKKANEFSSHWTIVLDSLASSYKAKEYLLAEVLENSLLLLNCLPLVLMIYYLISI